MTTDLIFQGGAPSNERPIDLVFGEIDTTTSTQTGELHVTLPRPTFSAAGSYKSNNANRIYAGASAGWKVAAPMPAEHGAPWAGSSRAFVGVKQPWQPAYHVRIDCASPFQRVQIARLEARTAWAVAHALVISGRYVHAPMRPIHGLHSNAWIDAISLGASIVARHQEMLRRERPLTRHGYQVSSQLAAALIARSNASAKRWLAQRYPWDQARRPPAGLSSTITPVPPITPPCYTPPAQDAVELYFSTQYQAGTDLIFACKLFDLPAQLVIPYRRVYVAAHTITVTTYPGGAPVVLTDINITTDADSYCWSLSATGPVNLMDQLAPSSGAPAQIRISIDGLAWVFAVEKIGRTRQFGQARAQLAGRSTTSALDDPWAVSQTWTNTSTINAAQVLEQVLDLSGITPDWSVDDWLIPSGAWSHTGTPLSAARRLAESIGAILHSHPSQPTLQVLRRYPLMPWEWYGNAIAPDVQLPLAAVLRESYERCDAPAYNRAIVSGTTQGVLGIVTRAGTAGDVAAPMVSDPLITAQEAVLQRAQSILGPTGRQALIALDLPVLTGGTLPGVLQLNQLTEVIEPAETWRGLVRGVQVKVSGAKVRQTVTMERNLE